MPHSWQRPISHWTCRARFDDLTSGLLSMLSALHLPPYMNAESNKALNPIT